MLKAPPGPGPQSTDTRGKFMQSLGLVGSSLSGTGEKPAEESLAAFVKFV